MRWKFLMVGARVEYVGGEEAAWVRFKETGTIVLIIDKLTGGSDLWDIAVDWDKEEPHRHDCGGKSRPGHGWWVKRSEIQIIF